MAASPLLTCNDVRNMSTFVKEVMRMHEMMLVALLLLVLMLCFCCLCSC